MYRCERVLIPIVISLLLIAIAGCEPSSNEVDGESANQPDRKPLSVVVSIQPLTLLVKPFLEEGDQLYTLLQGSQSPHDFTLKASDRRILDAADMLFWVGPDLERPLLKLSKVMKASIAMQTEDPTAVQHDHYHQHDHYEDHSDPHLWMSPELAIEYQRRVADWLISQRPGRMESIRKTLAAQEVSIKARAQDISRQMQIEIGAVQHYAAAHNAFGYFIEAFSLPKPYILSASPQLPPSAKSLVKAQKLLSSGQCILVESTNPAEWIDQFARSNQYRTLAIDVLADSGNYGDYSDWLGELGQVFINCLTTEAI